MIGGTPVPLNVSGTEGTGALCELGADGTAGAIFNTGSAVGCVHEGASSESEPSESELESLSPDVEPSSETVRCRGAKCAGKETGVYVDIEEGVEDRCEGREEGVEGKCEGVVGVEERCEGVEGVDGR